MSVGGFCIDYGKKQAGCKKCKQKLKVGELRIAKITSNPFSDEGVMKNYHHAACLFQTFLNVRATTKIIEEPGDIDGWSDVTAEDKKIVLDLIKDTLVQIETKRSATPKKKTPTKSAEKTSIQKPKKSTEKKSPATKIKKEEPPEEKVQTILRESVNSDHPDNSFQQFHVICQKVRDNSSYLAKTELLAKYFKKGTQGTFQGDLLLWVRLMIPGVVKRVYHMQSKQMIKIFSRIFDAYEEEMLEDLEQGDVAQTISTFFEKSKTIEPLEKCELSLHDVDQYLAKLSGVTKEEDQQHVLQKVTKRCTAEDLKMFIRLLKGDLRIQSGPKHILEALHPDAHEAFNSSRNIDKVIERVIELRESGNPGGKLDVGAALMQPVQPMLATPCKSIDIAFQKCPNGIFSEIKYDGERVQVHKQGSEFRYFSRSLKPVMPHKVKHFKEFIPKAFPKAVDLILDAEVLLVDNQTGNPLPFGSLGIHKGSDFKDADPCLFIFDCIFYNGENLMNKPLKERRNFLMDNMEEVGNRIKFSEIKEIRKKDELAEMIKDTFRKGLEGLMIKDKKSIYEPGKRHWLKIKKDYLNEGAMADSADLVVLGGWYGTGQKGGLISIFLMGCQDTRTGKWCTVSKVHTGHDDATLERLQEELAPNMEKIKGDHTRMPSWIKANRTMVPDFVVKDPKKSPVWEITGAEFSKAEIHTANGISIRFPRVTRIRDDKTAETATNLQELENLYTASKQHMDVDLDIDDKEEEMPDESPKKKEEKKENGKNSKKRKLDDSGEIEEKRHKPSFQLTEQVGDLFTCPSSSSLAHCISKDCRLGQGIAKIFKDKFGRIKDIENCKAGVGGLATLKDQNRYIYNLVTKEKYSDKPKYDSMRYSLEKMREHAGQHGVKEIAMPRIGCGLDGLQWPAVRTLLKNIFQNEDIKLVVYTLDAQNNPGESTEKNKQATVKDFFKKSDNDKKLTENKDKAYKESSENKNKSNNESNDSRDKSYKESSEYKNKSNNESNDSRDKSYKESNGSRDRSFKEPKEKKKEKDGEEKSPDKKSRRVDIGNGYQVLDPLPDVFKNLKIFIPDECEDYERLRRTVLGFAGTVVNDLDNQDLTHIVYSKGSRLPGRSNVHHVSLPWILHSIKLQKLQPEKYYVYT